MVRNILFALSLVGAINVLAQINVTPTNNANTLLDNITGPGVTISNVSINCPSGASGTFTGGSGALQISGGVVLSTGQVNNISGSGSQTASTNNGGGGNALLTNVAGVTTYDACVLTFTIVPTCGTLTIQFVFASEEYPTYVGSGFNDAFGFFVSGPNPLGGNYNNYNMATLPNGTPVTINNVNNGTSNSGPCMNCQYYINNSGGTLVRFNGMTTSITATINVVPCQAYTMTIGVADAGDRILDSAVFLEENGLSCVVDPVMTISPEFSTICPGQSVTITATGGTNHTWTPNIGLNTNTGATVVASPMTTTTYTVSANTTCGVTELTSTVQVVPGPTITVNNPSICQGATTTLTASGAQTYAWFDSGGNQIGTGATLSVSPTVTASYTVQGTAADGCIGTGTSTVTVNPLPTVTATDATVCAGQQVTLTGGGNAASYSWSGGVVNGVPFSPAGSGQYTVIGTSAAGCQNSALANVTVNPLPVVFAGDDTQVCTGSAVTLTATGANNYTWTNGVVNGIAFTPANTATYTVVGTDLNGCQASDQVTVVVLNNAPINAGADQTICAGSSTTITATGGETYTWNNGLGAGVSHTVSPATTTTYTVEGEDSNGCLGTDQVVITVLPLPTATITGTTTVCQNDAEPTITFTGANGTAPYTFTYTINGGANQTVTAVGNTATVTAPTGTAGTFTYNLVSVQESSSTACSQPQTGTVTITVNPLPTATIAGTTAVCQNATSPTVTFTGANGTAPYTFTYNINGGANQTVTSTGTTATVSAPTGTAGTFTYNLVSVQEGSALACAQAQTGSAVITVNPLPTATVSGTTAVCVDDAAPTITFTGANGTAPYTFTYNINGGAPQTITSVGNSATITVPTGAAGVFNVNLTQVQDASSTACSQPQTGTATVTVNANPVATISGASTYCTGSTATLNAGAGFAQYNWSTGATTQTVNVTDANNPITVTVTNAAGCSTTSAPFTVTENSVITANFTVEICQGESAVIHGVTQTIADVYSETYTTPSGCDSVANVTLIVHALPAVNAGADFAVCPGTPVTLSGQGAVTYAWNNGVTNGIAFTPAATQTYTVTGTDGNGCVNTDDIVVTVNPLPTATIAGTTAVCQNATEPTITFTGANGTAPYTFTYTINGGANQTVTSVGNTATVTAPTGTAGTLTYALVSVQEGSALACAQNQTGTAVITVNPLPTATVSGTTAVCQNATSPTVTFTGATGTAPYTFTYTINGGANQTVTSTGNSATVTAPTDVVGTFTYNLVSVQDASSTACAQAQTGTATITVNPLPTATIGGTTEVCQNGTAPTITFTGANGTAPYTFTYTINGGANQTVTSVGNTATVSAPTATAGTFTYNLVSVQDASSTACSQVQTGTAIVTVNPLPTATISGTTTVCINGQEPTITFTGANGTAPYTFTYNINGTGNQTIVSTGNTATITIPTGVTGTININLVSVQDASSTTCSQTQAGQATVTVVPLPNVFAGNDLTVCAGQSVVLTASGAQTYQWNNGVTNGVSFVPTETTTYTVTGTSAAGCVNTDVMTVTVIPLPVVNFSADNLVGCAPLTVTFENNTDSDMQNCQWSLNNGIVLNTCNSITQTFNAPGCYDISLTVTNSEGCVGTLTNNSMICVIPDPEANFYADPQAMTTVSPTTQLFNTSVGATNYIWSFGDGSPASTSVSPSHTYPEQAGIYPITLVAINSGGCADTITKVVTVTEDLIFYVPNAFTPDNDQFNETFKPIFTTGFDPFDKNYHLTIFNRWGETLFESYDYEVGWDGKYGGKLVQDGVYIWKIVVKRTNVDKREVFTGHVTLIR
jgi:gliding motility-associated-like protein